MELDPRTLTDSARHKSMAKLIAQARDGHAKLGLSIVSQRMLDMLERIYREGHRLPNFNEHSKACYSYAGHHECAVELVDKLDRQLAQALAKLDESEKTARKVRKMTQALNSLVDLIPDEDVSAENPVKLAKVLTEHWQQLERVLENYREWKLMKDDENDRL